MIGKDNYVNIWAGRASNEMALRKATELNYTEDGNLIPSKIILQTGMALYDEACVEVVWKKGPFSSWVSALADHSYLDTFLPSLEGSADSRPEPNDNSFVLIYGAPFQGDLRNYTDDAVQLRLVGTFAYK